MNCTVIQQIIFFYFLCSFAKWLQGLGRVSSEIMDHWLYYQHQSLPLHLSQGLKTMSLYTHTKL